MCIYYIQHVLAHNAIFCFCQIFVMLLFIVQKPNSGPEFPFQKLFCSKLWWCKKITVSPWATLPLGPKISQKQCCSSYVLKISVVQGIISVAQEILQKTVKSALLKVNTELFKNRVVSRTALLEVVLLKDLLYCKLLVYIVELIKVSSFWMTIK